MLVIVPSIEGAIPEDAMLTVSDTVRPSGEIAAEIPRSAGGSQLGRRSGPFVDADKVGCDGGCHVPEDTKRVEGEEKT